ncbi:conserved membrane hypothetical protein [Bosea sp. 62]|uniref:hypothetical protein n=1 Tax=unclassified Bosea (in: a-proteobacteria) TaxID=2653178 RepID=UPI001257DFC2|nr:MULTISPECIES: hypothetical protein [unclassified Bosea (in: a-proteobacteria)]CAD5247652.1 conserved membrane hypothetical protein [Bosea sp. 46]CAD5249213.1 conserved membrane hypothetical protein [Bosea sp. 21B]VVT45118.1 conserved membrane hypothetical protein [Bosea sp. EC-HK365B]VXB90419.1 conserved membrane hypothetical protein [Bosea sp. 62]
MQSYVLAAGVLMILIGIAHSVIGEILIFRQLRAGAIVPLLAPAPLRERHLRILWANWHLCSVLGWGLAALLIQFAMAPDLSAHALQIRIIAIATLAGSVLVLYATRGRHPGWLGLLVAAGLAWLGQSGA